MDGERWASLPLDRVFGAHHFLSRPSEIALLHIALLAELDAIAAVEYAVSLPGEHFLWGAGWALKLDEKPSLVLAIPKSASAQASVWAVAAALGHMYEAAQRVETSQRRASGETAEGKQYWEDALPAELSEIASRIVARADQRTFLARSCGHSWPLGTTLPQPANPCAR